MRYRLRTLLIGITVLSIYLASYSAIMEPTIYVNESTAGMIVSGHRVPRYRVNEPIEPIARIVFWPVAWIDQRIRPGFWGTYSDWPD